MVVNAANLTVILTDKYLPRSTCAMSVWVDDSMTLFVYFVSRIEQFLIRVP